MHRSGDLGGARFLILGEQTLLAQDADPGPNFPPMTGECFVDGPVEQAQFVPQSNVELARYCAVGGRS